MKGSVARLSFEARPTILWLQDEFAHATQEMEALVPRCFSLFFAGKIQGDGFSQICRGFGARFFEVKPG